jgi:hypothetical protein
LNNCKFDKASPQIYSMQAKILFIHIDSPYLMAKAFIAIAIVA